MIRFMDQAILTPTAFATSRYTQASLEDFNYDDVHPSQLTLGSMQHCFYYMRVDPDPLPGDVLNCRLTKDHFVKPVHGLLFEKFREMHDLGLEIEIMPIIKILHKRGLLDEIGGAYVVMTFHAFAYTVDSCESHFSQSEHRQDLRAIIEECAKNPANPLAGHVGCQGDHTSQERELSEAVAEVLEYFKKQLADSMATNGPQVLK